MNNPENLARFIHLHETNSTNHYLQTLLNTEVLPDESIVWADFQTSGRGQVGNSWESEAGMNLTCSLLFYPVSIRANQPFTIAEMAALSVKQMLDVYVHDVTIKWPNDIYWQNKKISGILIENELSGSLIARSVIGIGLNLNQRNFQSDALNPVSLTQITGQMYDRVEILNQLHASFHSLNQLLKEEGMNHIHQQYISVLYRRQGFHPYQDTKGVFEACIHDIELSGHLILERKDGTFSRYAFKEVCFL